MISRIKNIFNNIVNYSKLKVSAEIKPHEQPLVKAPPRIMVLSAAIIILSAFLLESNYFPEYLNAILAVRLPASIIALCALLLIKSKPSENRLIWAKHVLLLTVVTSSGVMVYLIPDTLLTNASIVGFMIMTSSLFLSWELKNQIIVAIYYNLIFAGALFLTYHEAGLLPFAVESFLFVFILSLVSIVTCSVNIRIRMIEENRNAHIKKSEFKYRSIIDNSSEGIFQSTIDGKWITVNKSMAQIFGYKDESEMMKNGVKEIYADPEDRLKIIKELNKNGKIENWRVRLKRRDGKIAVVRLNDRLVENENGETILEGNVYDISDQVKAEEDRQLAEELLIREKAKTEKLAKEAIRISGTKSKLLANLSHEIRTPMNGILGFLTLIEAGAYTNENELKMFSSNARQSAESLLEIINSILDLTKLEAGKIKAASVRFNLINLIDQSISVVSIKAKEKNIRIIKDIPESAETLLISDMVKLRQIFTNLLNNAVKFTIDGEIKISISTKTNLNNELELNASITDTGIGIPESRLKELFKPYSQIGDIYESLSSGTGLGLVICKEYVELLGGKISVSSIEGEGSSFSFTINCKVQSKDNSDDVSRLEKEKIETQFLGKVENYQGNGFKEKREKYKILLAEDNLINQKVTIKILNTFGYNVTAVNDGMEAVTAVTNDNYDIILMDLQMPNVDGFKATEMIRSLPDSKSDILIIALTAHALMGDKEKCLNAGMTDYLSKPVSGQDLVKKIDTLLDIRKDDKHIKEVYSSDISPLLDKNRLTNVSLGDYEFEKDLLTSYVSDLDDKYKNLIELSSNHELSKIVEIAHSIKGSSYSIGAVKVADEAYAIELSGKSNDWVNVNARIDKFSKLIDETNEEIENYLDQNKKALIGRT
ncbi:MAG: ATP-binding protein [Ignavibacteria bacterium]|nr:ATP-binding protein [Ignavibacteria bacterium]